MFLEPIKNRVSVKFMLIEAVYNKAVTYFTCVQINASHLYTLLTSSLPFCFMHIPPKKRAILGPGVTIFADIPKLLSDNHYVVKVHKHDPKINLLSCIKLLKLMDTL